MVSPTNLRSGFVNSAPPRVLHLDLNSAFASMEQQANPLLRGVPLVVAARSAPYGCILASSREAKLWGVKTGMTVEEGRSRCPFLVVREADPDKYRHIHHAIKNILTNYTDQIIPKSIDEFTLHFYPHQNPSRAGREIQYLIKNMVGEWLTVSVGIGPNRFLAKLASDLKKTEPFTINYCNLSSVYAGLTLPDLPGINLRFTRRLKEQGIFTPLDFFHSNLLPLKAAFRTALARDWYLRLRGWEVDSFPTTRRTFGQSYVLPHALPRSDWLPIFTKLVDKAARRMRSAGYHARAAHLLLRFANQTSFHRGHTQQHSLFRTPDLLKLATSLIPIQTPPVKHLAVTFFNLVSFTSYQCALFSNTSRDLDLTRAVDTVNDRFGPYTLHSVSMLGTNEHVRDAIAFGK